jgi:hypothetical protein
MSGRIDASVKPIPYNDDHYFFIEQAGKGRIIAMPSSKMIYDLFTIGEKG